MSNLWVGGLVIALGWLSVRASEPPVKEAPGPLVVPASSWANRQEPKPLVVSVDKPALSELPALEAATDHHVEERSPDRGLPPLDSLAGITSERPESRLDEAPAEPALAQEPQPASTPIDQSGPSLPIAVEAPAKAGPDMAEPLAFPRVPSVELGTPSSESASEPRRSDSPARKASSRPEKRSTFGDSDWHAAPGSEKESRRETPGIVQAKQSVFASAADSGTDGTPDLPAPVEEKATLSRPVAGEKRAVILDRAVLPLGKAEEKTAKPASSAEPRLVPTPTAALGTPHVISSEESVSAAPCRLYGSGEYLIWFTKGGRVPALVTTGPASASGILGQPGTVVLFGGPGTRVNDDVRQGGRFTIGYWLDPCEEWAVEGSFVFLGDSTTRFRAASDAFPLLARPFFRINTGSEFSDIATRSDVASGTVRVQSPTSFWGAELNGRYNLCSDCSYRIDGLIGFRYVDLRDGVHINEDLIAASTVSAFGSDRIVVTDRFDARNHFYGSQVGVDTEFRRGRFFLDLRGKVAVGDNHETVDILGSQTITSPQGAVQTFRGGVLALGSNIGQHGRDRFSVVPELTLSVGCHLTEQLRVSVGYNLLYWSNVVRAGDQVDRVVDETLIPNFGATHPAVGQNRPAVPFKETDYWAQGIMFSVEYRY